MFFRRINFRIGFWYSVAFLVSAIALFALTAYFLMDSLHMKDRALLIEKSREYSALFLRDGVSGLRLRATTHEIKSAQDFVVRLADINGKTLFIYSPDRSDDTDAPQLADIDRFLSASAAKQDWIVIPGGDFGDNVEIYSATLPTGEILQVGKDTEDREAFVMSFAEAYLQGLIPIFIFAIAIGSLLSNRLLKPIRVLTQTVESIRAGNTKARVHLDKGKDELHHLGSLFNELLEQTEKLVQGMRDTVDNVAHDLRTPIMRLQNSVEAALQKTPSVDEMRNALVDCKENSEGILRLVDGIMDITEAEAGTLRLKLEPVESIAILESAIDLYGFVAEEKEIKIQLLAPQSFLIQGDRVRLLQLVSNLVDNAIKYSDPRTTITLETQTMGERGIISIKDEGIGIPASDLERIWERLYRADQSRSSRGHGLGLSIVRAIAKAHNGETFVSPNPGGRGTTFSLHFPLSQSRMTKM